MPLEQCEQYLQQGNHNVGCHFTSHVKTIKQNLLYAYVIDTKNRIRIRPQTFMLEEQVKMSPPQNLRAELIGNETLFLMWDVPKENVLHYFHYEMEYRSNLNYKWQRQLIPDRSFSLPNVDPAKCYFFRLRFTIHENYATRGYWSEWTPALIWKGKTAVGAEFCFLIL
ncbi:cytokine receptor common subunit gamma-like [Leucoraja erinacea]|uniref:cytokine receptor common subunit gamma-like n=1 Tax=Leucoraja erinaceus TaxID=7782 RepID=UPI0024587C83|nr:cytokine receptor common subunit gamma-like [Leucoraja erinacea]